MEYPKIISTLQDSAKHIEKLMCQIENLESKNDELFSQNVELNSQITKQALEIQKLKEIIKEWENRYEMAEYIKPK